MESREDEDETDRRRMGFAVGPGPPGLAPRCSAMAMRYLGETMDIHCGGVDLVFPHHEDEIAQSEGATGKPFSRFWCHGEFLLTDGSKMAKRVGNVANVSDLREQDVSAGGVPSLCFFDALSEAAEPVAGSARGIDRGRASRRRFCRETRERRGWNAGIGSDSGNGGE